MCDFLFSAAIGTETDGPLSAAEPMQEDECVSGGMRPDSGMTHSPVRPGASLNTEAPGAKAGALGNAARCRENLLETGELKRDLWSPLSNISESFLCAGRSSSPRKVDSRRCAHTDASLCKNTAAAVTAHLSRGCLKRVVIISLYSGGLIGGDPSG